MKLQKKNKLIFAVIFISLAILTGCSPKKDKPEPADITFSWWGKEARHDYTLKGIDVFEKLHPEISVTPNFGEWTGYEEEFDSLYKADKTSDVMQINFDWLYKYSSDGNGFYNLNELSDILELSNFTLAELEYGNMNGQLNALPTAFNAIIPVYNEALFLKYGLSVPETWEDLFNAAKIMRQDDYYVFGCSKKSLFLLCVAWFEQTHGKSVFENNSTYNLTEEETGEMLQFFKKLFDEKVVFPGFITFSAKDFDNYKIASAVCWCSESSAYAKVVQKHEGNAVLGNFISTKGAGNSGWYLKPATMYAIKKDCADPKAAAKLVDYLLNSREMALLQGCEKGIPVSNKSLTTLMEENQLEEMEYLSLMKIRFNKTSISKMLPVMENNTVLDSFYNNGMSYINGKASLKECSAVVQTDINKEISTLN